MTRVEADGPIDKKQLKKEIRQEMRQSERRRKLLGCGGCLAMTAIAVGIPAFWILTLLARTGITDVPFLTERLYDPVRSVRDVTPLAGSNVDDIMQIFGARSSFDFSSGVVSSYLTENEVTTILRDGIAEAGDSLPFPVEGPQVAIEQNSAEIFFIVPSDANDIPVKVSFRPEVEGGEIGVDLQDAVIGSYEIPKWIMERLFEPISRQLLGSVSKGLGEVGSIEGIRFEEGTVDIRLIPSISLPQR